MSKIKIYEHSHFQGSLNEVLKGKYPVMPSTIKNEQLNSIEILVGYYANFYEHTGFRG